MLGGKPWFITTAMKIPAMKIPPERQGAPSPGAARHPLPLNGGEGFKSEFTSPLAPVRGEGQGGEGVECIFIPGDAPQAHDV